MRATDLLRRYEREAARPSWLRLAYEVAFWASQALQVLAMFMLASLLSSDDPSSVDDSMIPAACAALMALVFLHLLLAIVEVRLVPLLSALAPPCLVVLLPWSPWSDIHEAAPVAWAWLAIHSCALLWTLLRPRGHRAGKNPPRDAPFSAARRSCRASRC